MRQLFWSVTMATRCFCVQYEDEVELYLDIENDNEISDDLTQTTPLHWAAASGQAESVQSLLDLQVEASPVDVDGNTPLDYARQSGHQECVGLLERRLGIPQTAGEHREVVSESEPTAKNRRNGPLDFFVGLFRPKKPGKADANSNLSSDSSGCANRNSNQNNYFTLNVTLNGAPDSCEPGDQCSEDAVRELEKLHISRGDNPALQKKPSPEYELDEIPPASRPKDICVTPRKLGAKNSVLPPCDNEPGLASSYPDHSHLIRSPPPLLRREHSLSPVPSPSVMLRSETNRAQLEEDAAQILALHKGSSKPDQAAGSSASGNALYPITPRSGPDVSPVSPRKPLIIPESSSGRDVSPNKSRHQSVQLAPIKGPVPPKQILLNKRLEHIKSERTGMNRSPTPPGWLNSPTQNCLPEQPNSQTSPVLPHRRKKKKKRTSSVITDLNTTKSDSDEFCEEFSSSSLAAPFEPNKKATRQKFSTLPMTSPRNDKLTNTKRKTDLDRSINSLLH